MELIKSLTAFLCLAFIISACDQHNSVVTPTEETAIAGLPPVETSAEVENENFVFPWEFEFYSPCANNGQGEVLQGVDLYLHNVEHKTFTPNGGAHVFGQSQPFKGELLGLTTGDKYKANGTTGEAFHASSPEVEPSRLYINNFLAVGPGPNNNFLVKATLKLTYNANGDITATTTIDKVECR